MQLEGTATKRRPVGLALQILRSPLVLLWCLFIVLIPYYVFHSGLPQPSDFLALMLAGLLMLVWNRKFPRAVARPVRILLVLTAWIMIVNYGWVLALGDTTVMKSYAIFPLYYVFNVAVFLASLILYRRRGELAVKATFWALVASVLLQVLASFFYRTGMYRGQLFFNNPNQLGWYALLAGSLIALIQRSRRYSLVFAGIGLTACAYLSLLSGSRAALAGIAVLVFLLVFANPRVIVLASLAAIALVTVGGPVTHALNAAEERTLTDHHPNISFSEERGLDRLWRYPEYTGFGAGEGDFTRFKETKFEPGEIHSSFATLLFSYGLVGLVLFLVFLMRIVERAPLREMLMLAPALVYMQAHNGLRSSMLWILFATFAVLKTTVVPKRHGDEPITAGRLRPA